jgi:hypothetical protein
MPDETSQIKSRALRVLFDHIAMAEHQAGVSDLRPVKRRLDFGPTLETAAFIYRMVKNDAERAAFFRNPTASLKAAGLEHETAHAALIVDLVKDVIEKQRRPSPDDVLDSYTSKETDTHQQWKFDSSGRSAETTKGEIVGEKTKFDGFELVEEIFSNPEFSKTFFPSQPLVTPQLVQRIRQKLSAELGGLARRR